MKRRINNWKYLVPIALLTVALNSNCVVLQMSAKADTESKKTQNIESRAEIIRWRYKNENGIGYKRLFNYSTNKWIGKWERA